MSNPLEDKTGLVKDSLGPAAQAFGKEIVPVGRTLGKLTRYVLSPLEGLVWGIEAATAKLGARVEEIVVEVPPEKLVESSPRIAGPVLNAARYADDEEEIHELFAQLLASDIQVDKKGLVHPSFVEIIKQMSDADARLFAAISNDGGAIVLMRVVFPDKKDTGFWEEPVYWSFATKGIVNFEDWQPALDSLLRLGLIVSKKSVYPGIAKMADARKQQEELRASFAQEPGDARFVAEMFGYWITALGLRFAAVCLPPSPTEAAPAPTRG